MSRPVLIVPELLAAAPSAALAVALPAAMRASTQSVGVFEAWLALAGLLCPLLALGIAAARAARRAVTVMAPESGERWLVGGAIWAMASLPAIALIGAVLKEHTHHRGLAGATFAVLALGACLLSGLVSWRVTAIVLARARRGQSRSLARGFAIAAVVLLIATATAGALASGSKPEPESLVRIPALIVDGALALAAIALAAALQIPERRSSDAAWLGGGVSVFVFSVGLALAARSPLFSSALPDRAPLAGIVAQVLGLSDGSR